MFANFEFFIIKALRITSIVILLISIITAIVLIFSSFEKSSYAGFETDWSKISIALATLATGVYFCGIGVSVAAIYENTLSNKEELDSED